MATGKDKKASSKAKGAPKAALTQKPLTQRYKNLARYIEEQTGYKVEDPMALQLALALYSAFQKSNLNREYLGTLAEQREAKEAEREQRTKEREEKRAAKEAKAKERAAKKSTPAKASKKAKDEVAERRAKKKGPKSKAKKAKAGNKQPF